MMAQWHSPAEVTVGPAVNHRRQLSHGFTVTGTDHDHDGSDGHGVRRLG
jgi:hypothetical protein